MDVPTTKVCSKCHVPILITKFWPDRHAKDGLFHRCKPCCKLVQAEYRKKNREKICQKKQDDYRKNHAHIREVQNKWCASHKDSISKSNRKQYVKNRVQRLAYQKNYYEVHKEKILNYLKNYREIHRKRLKEVAKKWRLANPDHPSVKLFRFKAWAEKYPEKYKACRKAWLAKHPEQSTKNNLIRRARKKNAITVDIFTILDIAERDNWRCHICGKKVTKGNWSIDHHFPLASPEAIHGQQYVSLAHRKCNSRRGVGKKIPAQLRLF